MSDFLQNSSIQQAIDLALSHQRANRLAEADAIYRSVLKAQPDHFDALQLLGLVQFNLGNYVSAIELMGKALQINPRVATVQTNLGVAYSQLNRLDEAIRCHAAAISLKPETPAAHNNLGLVLLDKGHIGKAAACFERALAINPKMTAALANLGRTHLCRNNIIVGLSMTLKESGFIRFTREPSFKLVLEP